MKRKLRLDVYIVGATERNKKKGRWSSSEREREEEEEKRKEQRRESERGAEEERKGVDRLRFLLLSDCSLLLTSPFSSHPLSLPSLSISPSLFLSSHLSFALPFLHPSVSRPFQAAFPTFFTLYYLWDFAFRIIMTSYGELDLCGQRREASRTKAQAQGRQESKAREHTRRRRRQSSVRHQAQRPTRGNHGYDAGKREVF